MLAVISDLGGLGGRALAAALLEAGYRVEGCDDGSVGVAGATLLPRSAFAARALDSDVCVIFLSSCDWAVDAVSIMSALRCATKRPGVTRRRVVLGVSSLASWGGEGSSSLDEDFFQDRRPRRGFELVRRAEDAILAGEECADDDGPAAVPTSLRTGIVCAGVLFGDGEGTLASLFTNAWACGGDASVYLEGARLSVWDAPAEAALSTVHCRDFAAIALHLLPLLRDGQAPKRYVFAVPPAPPSCLSDCIRAIGEAFAIRGADYRTQRPSDGLVEAFAAGFSPALEAAALHQGAGPAGNLFVADAWSSGELHLIAAEGLCPYAASAAREFVAARRLAPFALLCCGPREAGARRAAEELADALSLVRLTAADAMAKFILDVPEPDDGAAAGDEAEADDKRRGKKGKRGRRDKRIAVAALTWKEVASSSLSDLRGLLCRRLAAAGRPPAPPSPSTDGSSADEGRAARRKWEEDAMGCAGPLFVARVMGAFAEASVPCLTRGFLIDDFPDVDHAPEVFFQGAAARAEAKAEAARDGAGGEAAEGGVSAVDAGAEAEAAFEGPLGLLEVLRERSWSEAVVLHVDGNAAAYELCAETLVAEGLLAAEGKTSPGAVLAGRVASYRRTEDCEPTEVAPEEGREPKGGAVEAPTAAEGRGARAHAACYPLPRRLRRLAAFADANSFSVRVCQGIAAAAEAPEAKPGNEPQVADPWPAALAEARSALLSAAPRGALAFAGIPGDGAASDTGANAAVKAEGKAGADAQGEAGAGTGAGDDAAAADGREGEAAISGPQGRDTFSLGAALADVAPEEVPQLEEGVTKFDAYLRAMIMPHVTQGMLELVRATPEDPIKFLEEFLRRAAARAEKQAEASAYLQFQAALAQIKEAHLNEAAESEASEEDELADWEAVLVDASP